MCMRICNCTVPHGPLGVYYADSPIVMFVINPAVGCQYFLPGQRLSSQLQSVTGYEFLLLGEQRHMIA